MASTFPPPSRRKSVTHVSGTFCYLCVEPHIVGILPSILEIVNTKGKSPRSVPKPESSN